MFLRRQILVRARQEGKEQRDLCKSYNTSSPRSSLLYFSSCSHFPSVSFWSNAPKECKVQLPHFAIPSMRCPCFRMARPVAGQSYKPCQSFTCLFRQQIDRLYSYRAGSSSLSVYIYGGRYELVHFLTLCCTSQASRARLHCYPL